MRSTLSANEASVLRRIVSSLPDPLNVVPGALRVYKKIHGHYPNILSPKTFSEKIQRRKIFDRRPLLALIADKYAVRDYVSQRLGAEVLPKLLCVTDNPAEMDLASMPRRFVVKATHGSGWVYLVKDKDLLDEADLLNSCSSWLRQSFYDLHNEWAYKAVPRRIIVEEFLDDGSGEAPMDYKLFVFGGKVELIQVDVGRFSGHRRNLYDVNWNRLGVKLTYDNYEGSIASPAGLREMIRYAEILGSGLDFVRVDLYNVGRRVVFGELTGTPTNGFGKFDPVSFDHHLGTLWEMQV